MSTNSSITLGLQVTSILVAIGKNRINSITLLGDGTNASSITLYDNTSASGKIVAKVNCKAADQQNHIIFTNPVSVENGIYASLSGTGGNYIIYFGG